ncbi:MAG: hypothetical protein HBSAPP03_27830 [Phycisphaerae bacterium]|nr:MAG: hypothetical protein HBSAPP03_27830 [Phycisphaerae bacterium]
MTRGIHRIVVAMVAAVLALCVGTVRAQWFGGGDFTPDLVTKRGVLGYAKVLGLDEEQKATALMLLDGTKTEYRKEMKTFQDKMKAIQTEAMEDQDWSKMQREMPDLVAGLQTKVQGLEKQFFEDLRAICTPEQGERWEHVERYRRREMFLKVGMVSGAAADISALLDQVGDVPTGNAEYREAVAQYELDVDKPLREFERIQREQERRSKDAMEQWAKDPQAAMDEMNKMMEKLVSIGKDIRGINRETIRRVAPLLSEEAARKLRAAYDQRSFPRVYRESHATKLLTASLGLSDLTAEQRAELTALRDQYVRDAAAANERWTKIIEEDEEKNNGTMGRMMQMAQGWGGGDDNSPEKEARKARKELDEKAEERVKAILSAGQWGKMPEKKVEARQPWEDMMPDRREWVDDDIVIEPGK